MAPTSTPLPFTRLGDQAHGEGDGPPSPVRLIQILGRLIATAALVVVAMLVVTVVVTIPLELAQVRPGKDDRAATMAMGAVSAQGGVLLAMWALSARKNRWRCSAADFALVSPPRPTRQVLAWTVGAVGAVFLATGAYQLIAPAPPDEAVVVVRDAGGLSLTVLVVAAIWMAPVAEELLCRGVIYRTLRSRCRPAVAALISATLFAVPHMDLRSMPVLVASGVVFAVVLERTGSLIPAIVAHSTLNTVAFMPYHAGLAATMAAPMMAAFAWTLLRSRRHLPRHDPAGARGRAHLKATR